MNQPKRKTAKTLDPEIITEVMHITPATAKNWLSTNINRNRPLSKPNLQMLERELREGRWKVNGEAIKFDINDQLIDGQHRLTACVNTGIPIDSLVIMGIQPETFDTLDTGRSRGIADVLAINGVEAGGKYGKLAAGIRTAIQLQQGTYVLNGRVSNDEAIEWLHANPGITEFVNTGKMTRRLLPSAVYIGMRYLITQKHPVEAGQFFELFESGVGLTERSPIKALRDKLVIQQGKAAKLRPLDITAMAIKAWNLFLSGRTTVNLRYRAEEDFPAIK